MQLLTVAMCSWFAFKDCSDCKGYAQQLAWAAFNIVHCKSQFFWQMRGQTNLSLKPMAGCSAELDEPGPELSGSRRG